MAKKSDKLSDRQVGIVKFISEYFSENGRPPTIREIGNKVEISSTSVVNYNLTRLQDKGYVIRENEVSRGLRLTEKAQEEFGKIKTAIENLVSIPIVGDIVASDPVPIGETQGMYDPVEVSSNMLNTRTPIKDLFAVRVNGDSMIDAMISDGDTVIMEPKTEVRNGEMAAVWINDDTMTLKHFFLEADRENKSQKVVRLQPANPTYQPTYYPPEQVQIQGKVVMVVRQNP
ncbi:MAG: transcriptional repressor LexA [Chloroflexota bacterium]